MGKTFTPSRGVHCSFPSLRFAKGCKLGALRPLSEAFASLNIKNTFVLRWKHRPGS